MPKACASQDVSSGNAAADSSSLSKLVVAFTINLVNVSIFADSWACLLAPWKLDTLLCSAFPFGLQALGSRLRQNLSDAGFQKAACKINAAENTEKSFPFPACRDLPRNS